MNDGRDLTAEDFALPLTFHPIYKEKIWGGNRLRTLFKRDDADASLKIGESWEVSARDDNDSIVSSGPLAGWSLNALWRRYPKMLLGVDRAPERFPLLVKLIDAADDLSVQVHPDDAYAMAHENDLGKAECWVVLDAEPGSRIQRGLEPGVTRDIFADAIRSGKIMDCLHFIPAEIGMVLAQPSGCVHAIGKGVLLAEIQQNSDVTYRVYDYDRPGLDGRPRALHVDNALNVIGFDSTGTEFDGDMSQDTVAPEPVFDENGLTIRKLVSGRKFHMARVDIAPGEPVRWPTGATLTRKNVFEIWMVLNGALDVTSNGRRMTLNAVSSALLPAAASGIMVTATEPVTLLWAAPEEFLFA